ncbi:MAG: TIGR01777 family oxidoreductase [Oceanospirillaceae bacterium]|nr:TIGR01777 family oxidoreductase [Oceanospirillaceae bacterium]
MEILITGGTGLIGRAFIEQFNAHHFTVLSRAKIAAPKQPPASGQVTLIHSLDHLHNLDLFDAVINLAGEPIIDKRWSTQQKQVIRDSRWLLTQRLVDLFENSQRPPSVFLNGSAIGVYGDHGAQDLTEEFPVQVYDFPTELCLGWEDVALKASPYTRVVLLRTGIVLSAKGGALAKMLLPFKCFLGGRIGDGEQYMSWIHYQDHIHAMHHVLLEKSIVGPVNLVAPDAQKNRAFTASLAASLNRVAVLPVPRKAMQLLLGESACLLLDSQKVVPEKLLDSGFKFKFSTLKLALQDLLGTRSS